MKKVTTVVIALAIAASGWGIALYQVSQASNNLVCDSSTGKCYDPHPDPSPTVTPSVTPTPIASPLVEVAPVQTPTVPQSSCSE